MQKGSLKIVFMQKIYWQPHYQVPGDPGGGGYCYTWPIRVCAPQQGHDFEAPDLERGSIHFRGVF